MKRKESPSIWEEATFTSERSVTGSTWEMEVGGREADEYLLATLNSWRQHRDNFSKAWSWRVGK